MKAENKAPLVALCFLIGQCNQQVHRTASWWNWVFPGSGWAWNRQTRVTKSCRATTRRRSTTKELREHGIKLLGSTIAGLGHHTPENIEAEVEHAVAHETDFHQFMLYTPVPGTPLYKEMLGEGRLLDVDLADIHGQHKVQLQTRCDLARRNPSAFSCSLPARLRLQRPELVSHLRDDTRGMEAIQKRPRPAHSGTLSPGKSAPSRAPTRILSCGRWNTSCAARIPVVSGADPCTAPGSRPRIRDDEPRDGGTAGSR